jgi:Na+-driven multidrug efflux pump
MVSLGMLCMSIGTVWLNAVTGTGRTKVNLSIEIVAIIIYIIYIYYVMVRWRLSLTITWSNELVYWTSIFILAFWYIKSGKWKTADSNQFQPRMLNEADAIS